MKHTVHVTITYSVEVDDTEIKAEFGKATKKMILQHAVNNFDPSRYFDCSAKIFESYSETTPKLRRGIGSH
jgi:hypothetical protein